MTYLPGRSAAAALFVIAAGMRMFWGMAVDYPFAMNAAWTCPLLGLLIFLPIGFALNQASKIGSKSIWGNLTSGLPSWLARILEIILAMMLIYDAAVVVRLLASSANLIALNNVTVHLLILPLALVVAFVIHLGGDAAGNSARIWLKILPVFGIILFIVQFRSFRIGWITPVFGGGLNSIINGSIYCAGCLALNSLTWMIAVPDRNKRGILVYAAVTSIAVALLMLMQHMSFPALINIPFTRAARIELILSNGRMSLSPQLLLDVIWFGNLLQLISAEVVTAASYLLAPCKRIPKWLVTVFLSTVITLLAVFNPEWLRASSDQTQLQLLEVGIILGFLLIASGFRKDVNLCGKT